MPNRQKDHKELLFYLKVWIEFKKYVKRNRNWYANELHSNDNPTTTTISKLLLCLLLTHRPYQPYTISCLIRKFYMIPSRDNHWSLILTQLCQMHVKKPSIDPLFSISHRYCLTVSLVLRPVYFEEEQKPEITKTGFGVLEITPIKMSLLNKSKCIFRCLCLSLR